MHCASLVHDDIIDRDKERRGMPSYYKKFGVEDAILTGHRLITMGLKKVLERGVDFLSDILDTWEKTLQGEISDVRFATKKFRKPPRILYKMYREVILQKTAIPFATACKLGAKEADAPASVINSLYNYGKKSLKDCRW